MGILSALKVNLLHLKRDKLNLFWNTFFPMILATFFCLIIPNMGKNFDKVNVGINKNNPHEYILKQIPYLNLKEVKEDYQWANPDYPDCEDCGEWLNWLQSEAE